MLKHVLFYGLIAGCVMVLFFIIEQPLVIEEGAKPDMKTGELWGYISMLVSLSMIFFGVRSYRNKYLHGVITFGKAFQIGLWISLIASLIYVVGWMVLYSTSETLQNFPDMYLDHMLEELKKSGKTAAEMAETEATLRKNMELYKNPFIMMAVTFMEIFPVGLVIDVVTALLLRKKATASVE